MTAGPPITLIEAVRATLDPAFFDPMVVKKAIGPSCVELRGHDEIGLVKVQGDRLLVVRRSEELDQLQAPGREARSHDDMGAGREELSGFMTSLNQSYRQSIDAVPWCARIGGDLRGRRRRARRPNPLALGRCLRRRCSWCPENAEEFQ